MRAKDDASTLPPHAGDDFKYAIEGEELGSADEESIGNG